MILKWMNPAESKLGATAPRFDRDLVETLKRRPNRWALVAQNHAHATNVYTFAKRYGLQVTTRGSRKTGFDIYMRYVSI
jgi:hypothetical protein